MQGNDEPISFLIERDISGAGKLSEEELKAIARKSCAVLDELRPSIQWIHSYVTDDRIYCIYSAPNEEFIQRHAEMGGFPANRVSRVGSIIDPSSALE